MILMQQNTACPHTLYSFFTEFHLLVNNWRLHREIMRPYFCAWFMRDKICFGAKRDNAHHQMFSLPKETLAIP